MPWTQHEANVVRSMIEHESRMINHRLTWLVTVHGLLFAALGLLWKDGADIVPILSCLGVTISISIFFPLWAADLAIRKLVRDWDENSTEDERTKGPDIIGKRPAAIGVHFIYPWLCIPIALAAAWIVVWILSVCGVRVPESVVPV